MKNMQKKILVVSLLSAFAAGQVSAATSNYKVSDVANIAVPASHAISKQATTYIWPAPHQAGMNHHSSEQQRVSNEYWQVVSGFELNHGLALHATSDALVRLAAYTHDDSGSSLSSVQLDPEQIQISSGKGQIIQAERLISEQDMRLAGFDDGSIAVKLPQLAQGKLALRSEQALPNQARFLLHVKEKNSPFLLDVTAPSQVSGTIDNTLGLTMSIAGNAVTASEVNVRVYDPKGQRIAVEQKGSTIKFNDDLRYFGAHQGLYEVEIEVTKAVRGNIVKRTIKMPFANQIKTAAFEGSPQLDEKNRYQMPIAVIEPGRYSVTATLQGKNKNGEWVRLQTAESANWLEHDANLTLPFTLEEFSQYNRFELVDVKLQDQSRMMLQQVAASGSAL